MVENVHFIVEEPSMEKALLALLPRILREVPFEIYTHTGKQDLLKKLPNRLASYSSWLPASWRLVVICDRDDDDCEQLKAQLEGIASAAGLPTRTNPFRGSYKVVNRIAIEELEAWYFGDWDAVVAAYPRAPSTTPKKAPYRYPDAITGGTWEAFERVMQKGGYFNSGLLKQEAATLICEQMIPERNTSPSFKAFYNVLREFTSEP